MLTHIKKIKSFGVFSDYTAADDLPAFGRYNVVYGENGSGKTTFSRLLASLEAGAHIDHPHLEYLVESQSGQFAHGSRYPRRVRVFNSDYVEANIGRLDGPLKHILILGEENKSLVDQLKAEIATRDFRETRMTAIDSNVARLDSDRGKQFSQIAKTISEATTGKTVRSYRKPDAESAFQRLTITEPLSDAVLDVHRATVRQEQMPTIGQIAVPRVATALGQEESLLVAHELADRTTKITKRSAQSAVIDRLAANSTLARWVEQGLHIHEGNTEGKCEFCSQPLTPDRLKGLADHFSEEDQKLKIEIEAEKSLVEAVIAALGAFEIPDELALYSELRADYSAAKASHADATSELAGQLIKIRQILEDKLTRRTSSYDVTVSSDSQSSRECLASLNSLIMRHDQKTARFEDEKNAASRAIEDHYLFTIKDQILQLDCQIADLKSEKQRLSDGGEGLEDSRSLDALSQSIVEKQARVLNAHIGGADLTSHLRQFLGRTDLCFESSNEGYIVLRRGKPAKRLSEGERTAIAFLYFLVQLQDQDFSLSEGVVVIDDPISSLDASAIYQAFSFLKNKAQTAKQLFILTHNFEFLRLLINWVQNMQGVPKAERTFTMVLCNETEKGRSARLVKLDQLLLDHATEYQYLFKVLLNFKSDGTILGCYHIPNIARKVLETFLDFYVPSNRSLYKKLEQVDFDPHKKTAINKFAQDLSHHTGKGFDPALVAETQKNAAYLLEMIETVAPMHFKGLKDMAEA